MSGTTAIPAEWLKPGAVVPVNADTVSLLVATIRSLVEGQPAAASGADLHAGWQPIATAPKDGTIVRLLVDYRGESACHPLEDAEITHTIGGNTDGHTGLNEGWKFAGWSWEQDCFCEGRGKAIGWLPFAPVAAPARHAAAELVAAAPAMTVQPTVPLRAYTVADHHAALQRIGSALGLLPGADLHRECVHAIEKLKAEARGIEFCPRCYSPQRDMHPSDSKGTAWICSDPWHRAAPVPPAQGAGAAVPPGMVLVPREATEAMFRALTDPFIAVNGDNRKAFAHAYTAMLDAALSETTGSKP